MGVISAEYGHYLYPVSSDAPSTATIVHNEATIHNKQSMSASDPAATSTQCLPGALYQRQLDLAGALFKTQR